MHAMAQIEHVCAAYLTQCISDTVQKSQIGSLICQCVFWMIIAYGYYRLKLFLYGRHREARQQELLRAHRSKSDTERELVEQLGADTSNLGPMTNPTQVPEDGAAQEMVPVSVCGDSVDALDSLKDEASRLRALGQEVTFLQTDAGPVVQTKMRVRAGDTASKLQEIAMKNRFLVQLGGWRLFHSSKGDKEARMVELDDINHVPVILHSSYSGGILTVEGLHLRQATIQTTTKDNCIILEAKDNGGPQEMEVFTTKTRLPSNNLVEVFVLASKKIVVDGQELRVNSIAIQIQNDNLRTVLRTMFPFIALLYATNQILLSAMKIMKTTNTTSIVIWLWTSCMFLISTFALPPRIETAISVSWKMMVTYVYLTIYFAIQCFKFDQDQGILNMNEGVSKPESRSRSSRDSKSRFAKPNQSCKNNQTKISTLEQMTTVLDDEGDVNLHANDKDSLDNPEWNWPIFDTIYEKNGEKLVRRIKDDVDKTTIAPFEVIYRNVIRMPWASQVQVKISSPFLIDIMKDLIEDTIDPWAKCSKNILINGPELFRIHEALKKQHVAIEHEDFEASSSDENYDKGGRKMLKLHLNHLMRFMEKEFEDIQPVYDAMKLECKVSWKMLWVFFPPQEKVVYFDPLTEERLLGEIQETWYGEKKNKMGDLEKFFFLKINMWDYNGLIWKKCTITLSIDYFNEGCLFGNLKIYPLQFDEDPQAFENVSLERGKLFCELSMMERSCYMNYKGLGSFRNEMSRCFEKENADGRVMIDLASFGKMNPNFPMNTAKLPYEVLRDNKAVSLDIREDENRKFAPAIVYGFSFHLKKWGAFSVCGFSPINFNASAFEGLVMNEPTKKVLEKLVRKQVEDGKDIEMQGRDRIDTIESKGEGCIFLCYGPPGTGKTLTAESLSEKLKCPLWSMSVSELGTNPQILEVTLKQVMDVAALWGAILLLDEADVFLERRSRSSLTNNAVTGVFLRQLEYYRGVLFLTTNRESAFDDAVCSRITMSFYYAKQTKEQRKIMWTKLFDRVGLKEICSKVLEEFAKFDINGREMRNIVKSARTLSRSEDDSAPMEVDYIRMALQAYEESSKIRPPIGNLTPPIHEGLYI